MRTAEAMTSPTSIPDVVDAVLVRGARAEGPPQLLIEVAHGATRTSDYESLARLLVSPLPDALIDFFYVNTDTGAFELALAVAEGMVAEDPGRSVAILRCLIPRTFIDCNRRLDATPEEFKAGGVAPGVMPWITAPEDLALLRSRYDAYVGAVARAAEALPADGAMLLLHTYAPRSVGVEVGLDIVERLHWAYQPDIEARWPLRPEFDVIGRDVAEGVTHAPAAVVAALGRELAALGMVLGDGATYPLHPSTLGYHNVTRRPGRGLCLEVRRDLFVERFEPFAPARIAPERVARLAPPLIHALAHWW